jgi:hypothetical protein
MVSGIDPLERPSDLSLFVDQKAHSIRPGRLGILASAVCECDRSIEVAEQRKLELILVREGGVRFHTVEAGAEDLDVVFIVVVLMVAEPATLGRSARGVCCRVKPQQHLSTPQIGQCYSPTVVRGQCKIRSPLTSFEHFVSSPFDGQYPVSSTSHAGAPASAG